MLERMGGRKGLRPAPASAVPLLLPGPGGVGRACWAVAGPAPGGVLGTLLSSAQNPTCKSVRSSSLWQRICQGTDRPAISRHPRACPGQGRAGRPGGVKPACRREGCGRRERAVGGRPTSPACVPASPPQHLPCRSPQRRKNPQDVVYNVSRGGGLFSLRKVRWHWRALPPRTLCPCPRAFAYLELNLIKESGDSPALS